ncbi:hypothetical protein EMIHUDRAFT_443320 [Emiliania huxleyi CCMP1516]|uniref:Uncharacterized protein n=2 Tax=Emiliania huxleyi TaxID=2903 RepID=A0A0D3JTR1_EMIH1|nr:hypothetical protein EMIHUDRAFT_443320 [Emiliania huxleyi CCMP1516]EOD26896.1 hypothetical protein EMIHUDRAFT_443320 [Emiliania huxleyi CCMP1516]|eukprot:XP_005779325.1 hypothetical protein EMIHUDRAFT_443320 [Emiliania huxleyi CCMP1516]
MLSCKLVLLLAVCGARGFLLPVAHRAAVSTTASQYAVAARLPAVQMGRGDKRTKKGKRTAQTFGNARPKNGKLRRERDGPMENVAAVKAAAAAAAKAEEEAAAAAAAVKAEAEAAAAAAAEKAEEEAAAAAAKAEEEAAAAAAAAKAEEAAAAAAAAKAEEEAAAAAKAEEAAAAAAKAEEEAAAAEAEEAAAPALSASDLMALMKQLRAELPRADLKAPRAMSLAGPLLGRTSASPRPRLGRTRLEGVQGGARVNRRRPGGGFGGADGRERSKASGAAARSSPRTFREVSRRRSTARRGRRRRRRTRLRYRRALSRRWACGTLRRRRSLRRRRLRRLRRRRRHQSRRWRRRWRCRWRRRRRRRRRWHRPSLLRGRRWLVWWPPPRTSSGRRRPEACGTRPSSERRHRGPRVARREMQSPRRLGIDPRERCHSSSPAVSASPHGTLMLSRGETADALLDIV